MFTLEERKQHTKYLTEKTKQFLFKITNNDTMSAYYLIIFHWVITGIPLMYIIFGDVNLFYYLSCLLWICICIIHFYFAGCICTRIERKLWNANDWWGPWIFYFTPLELIGIQITTNLANNIFICWGICLAVIALLKILYNMK
jgi:hypothetical protein